jgi:hypothetical protein
VTAFVVAAFGPVDILGVSVGLGRPVAVLAAPVAIVLLYGLVLRGGSDRDADGSGDPGRGRPGSAGGQDRRTTDGGVRETGASRRARRALFLTRLVVVVCLVVAAAAPFAVATRERTEGPQVTMLVDRSASTAVAPDVADDIAAGIEDEGVDVTRSVVASGNRSRLGDGVVANLRANGSVLLVSDGRVTGGRDLSEAAEVARRLNASVNVVAPSPNRPERAVGLAGPATTSVGVESRFLVSVEGVDAGVDEAATTELLVTIDGEEVERTTLDGTTGDLEVRHTFERNGTHRVTARLAGADRYSVNDVARKTVTAVPEPRVLYVSRGEYPLRGYLAELYRVSTARSVPDDLDPYAAVVLQDVPAGRAGNVSALGRYVLDGGGLVVAGGENAFAAGNYSTSRLGALVPVRSGDRDGRRSRLVLAVDVSGSAEAGMTTQKAIALDVLNQLGDRNEVGLVAFDSEAHRVAPLRPLDASRANLKAKVRRLRPGGKTSVAAGLSGAGVMLDGPGTVVLVSDGQTDPGRAFAAADGLDARDISVVAVGVGRVNGPVLDAIADRTGGSYLRASETDRLRIRFGGSDRRYRGGSLTVLDGDHFVTAGVRTTASLAESNDVSVKPGADFLVATGDGDPAVSTWRYGVGRVVAVTAYDARGGLGGLLSAPNSLLVSKSVNWAVGDPRRAAGASLVVPDTRAGRNAVAVYRGADPPSAGENGTFVSVGDGRYEATFTPRRPGYATFAGEPYAVNYRPEYAAFGPAPTLSTLTETTGGQRFAPDETAAIADAVASQTRRTERTRVSYDWLFLLVGFAVFLGEVCVRRLERLRGTGTIP